MSIYCRMRACLTALAFFLVCTTSSRAQPSYGYYGWTRNGCPAKEMAIDAYNSLDSLALGQWWTVTFTDDVEPIGGMVRPQTCAFAGCTAVPHRVCLI